MFKHSKIKKKEDKDAVHQFDKGSVFSVLIKVAIPIIVLMLFNAAYAFIDSLMSTKFVDYGTVNGVELNGGTSIGLIFPLITLLVAFIVMVTVGSGLSYTQSLSQKKYVEAQNRKDESIILLLIIASMVLLVIILFGYPYLKTVSNNWGSNPTWGSATENMVIDGYTYMIVLGISFFPMQMTQLYLRILRGEGKGNLAIIIPVMGFPINIFFDWFLMGQVGIGLIGAGIATLIANLTTMLLMMGYIAIKESAGAVLCKIRIPEFKIHKELSIIILTFAMSSFLRRFFGGITFITFAGFVGHINPGTSGIPVADWTSAWTVMTRTLNMGIMLSLGAAQSISMLIAFYSGSKQPDKIKKTVIYGGISMIVCSISSALFIFGMQEIIFSLYNPNLFRGWFSQISWSFTILLLFSIPASMQPLAVMFYGGMKNPKLALIHTIMYNGILIAIVSIGCIINQSIGIPLVLFGSMFIGSCIALFSVAILFINSYKKEMKIII